ncbi:hypothetical protein [Ferruginibacter sp.]
MKKILFLLLFWSSACHIKAQVFNFELGISKDSLKNIYKEKNILVVVGRSNIIDGYLFRIDSLHFKCGFDKTGKVIYYSTEDADFSIEGFRYLTADRKSIDSIRRQNGVNYSLKFGAFINLKYGWKLGFSSDDLNYKNGKMNLKNDAVPMRLFKIDAEYI